MSAGIPMRGGSAIGAVSGADFLIKRKLDADRALAFASLLGAGKIFATRAEVRGAGGLFALDRFEPGFDRHTLRGKTAPLAPFRGGGGPVVFRRNAIYEVKTTIDEIRRRLHGLPFFDEFFIGGDEFGSGITLLVTGDFGPLIQDAGLALIFFGVLALKQSVFGGLRRRLRRRSFLFGGCGLRAGRLRGMQKFEFLHGFPDTSLAELLQIV